MAGEMTTSFRTSRRLPLRGTIALTLVLLLAVLWTLAPYSIVVVQLCNNSSETLRDVRFTVRGAQRSIVELKPAESRTFIFFTRIQGDDSVHLVDESGDTPCGYLGRPSASIIARLKSDSMASASCRNGLWLFGL